MIDRVMKAPINKFFDITRLEHLINRFAKDLSLIETSLVFEIGTGYVSFYNLLSVFAISAFVIPWILLILPFMLILTIWLYRTSIAATKETVRIEKLTRSPFLTFISEVQNG